MPRRARCNRRSPPPRGPGGARPSRRSFTEPLRITYRVVQRPRRPRHTRGGCPRDGSSRRAGAPPGRRAPAAAHRTAGGPGRTRRDRSSAWQAHPVASVSDRSRRDRARTGATATSCQRRIARNASFSRVRSDPASSEAGPCSAAGARRDGAELDAEAAGRAGTGTSPVTAAGVRSEQARAHRSVEPARAWSHRRGDLSRPKQRARSTIGKIPGASGPPWSRPRRRRSMGGGWNWSAPSRACAGRGAPGRARGAARGARGRASRRRGGGRRGCWRRAALVVDRRSALEPRRRERAVPAARHGPPGTRGNPAASRSALTRSASLWNQSAVGALVRVHERVVLVGGERLLAPPLGAEREPRVGRRRAVQVGLRPAQDQPRRSVAFSRATKLRYRHVEPASSSVDSHPPIVARSRAGCRATRAARCRAAPRWAPRRCFAGRRRS